MYFLYFPLLCRITQVQKVKNNNCITISGNDFNLHNKRIWLII